MKKVHYVEEDGWKALCGEEPDIADSVSGGGVVAKDITCEECREKFRRAMGERGDTTGELF